MKTRTHRLIGLSHNVLCASIKVTLTKTRILVTRQTVINTDNKKVDIRTFNVDDMLRKSRKEDRLMNVCSEKMLFQ